MDWRKPHDAGRSAGGSAVEDYKAVTSKCWSIYYGKNPCLPAAVHIRAFISFVPVFLHS